METPKSRKLRITKRSSRKKREEDNEVKTPKIKAHRVEDATSSTNNITPPRTKLCKFVERKQEEIRSVEWQYYGKYAEADIPVVWGSPLASPTTKPERNVRDTPTNVPRAQNVSSFPRHCASRVEEPPQFLNEILALSESIKAQEEKRTQSISTDFKKSSDGLSKIESASRNPQVLDDSFSNLFDESMNECLVQCTQEVENSCASVVHSIKEDHKSNDVENKANLLKCNVSNISPRRKCSAGDEGKLSSTSASVISIKNTLKDNGSLRVGNKNYVNGKRKTKTYVFQGRVLGSKKTLMPMPESEKHLVNNEKKKRSVLQLCNNVPKTDQISKSINGSSTLDDSLETIKASFFEDDMDILSTIPVDLDSVTVPENSDKKSSETEIASKNKGKHKNDINVSLNLDDSTYFEDDFLQLLDSIESSAMPTSSPKLRCTPEEIEKKRQEAKSKLERKKLSLRKNKV